MSTNGITKFGFFNKTAMPPAYEKITQWFDGRIVGNELIDRKGIGNLQIYTLISGSTYTLGKDFDSYWIKGIPYKTACFFAQKAETYGKIPNPNNFWFDSGGTPNYIPVCCLFNNIDYGNQIFCNRKDPSYDITYLETWEGRVGDIVTYSAPLTGNDLVKANNYFKVPTKLTSNIREVGAGKTYSTVSSAISASVAGDTIYIYSGVYIGKITINKSLNIIGLGYSVIAPGVVNGLTIGGTSLVEGIMLDDGNITGGYAVTVNAIKAIVNRCYIKNVLGYGAGIINSSNTSIKNSTANGTFFIGTNASFDNIEFISNYTTSSYSIVSKSNGNFKTTNFKLYNCHSEYNQFTTFANIDAKILGNYINGGLQFLNGNFQNTVSINKNIINLNRTNGYGIRVTSATLLDNTWDITSNIINIQTNGSCAIQVNSQKRFKINNNLITGINDNAAGISINADRVTTLEYGEIKSNIIDFSKSTISKSTALISISSEIEPINCFNGIDISGNKCIGVDSSTTTSHVITIFNTSVFTCKYNSSINGNLGYVVKNAGLNTQNSVLSYNLAYNNLASLIIKGNDGLKVYNNTFHNFKNSCVNIVQTETGEYAKNIEIKNNIINSNYPSATSFFITNDNNLIGLVSNYNQINSPVFCNNKTKTQWLTLGYDSDSLFSDPNLKSNNELWPTTPIIIGQNLGTTYEDGLDTSSVCPTIITKKQPNIGNWQIGAYVQ